MKSPFLLSPYFDSSEPTRGEWRELKSRINEAAISSFPDSELEGVREGKAQMIADSWKPAPLWVLTHYLNRSKFNLSRYMSGSANEDPPESIIRLFRKLTERVEENPHLAYKAYDDHSHRGLPRLHIFTEYLDIEPAQPGEFKKLRMGMCDRIRDQFSKGEWDTIKSDIGNFKPVTQSDLEFVLDRSKDRISEYESNADEVPDDVIRLLRLIAEDVHKNPTPARNTLVNYHKRQVKDEQPSELGN